MCDAGGMAMSKDVATGGFDPKTGYGMAKGEEGKGWVLGRVSQEHGVLTTDSKSAASLEIGQKLFIRPQHAARLLYLASLALLYPTLT
jgi:D-serine deaminase-like pyridoxal phosphate-dependent protein